nr:NfeD family protein [Streptomyces sp. SID14446]
MSAGGARSYHDHVDDIDAWVWWLIGAAGLGIPLVVTAMPEFGMFAVGAVAASVVAGLGGGIVAQVLVFVVVSVALIAVVRPIAARHSAQRPQLASGIDALKGRQAVVLERVDGSGDGRIKLAGEIWSARALDAGQAYEVGQEVDVVDIDGATAIVM